MRLNKVISALAALSCTACVATQSYQMQSSFSAAQARALLEPDLPEYHELVLSTTCDGQGNFRFENVADGDFYVVTAITWETAYTYEGGPLMKRVSLQGGETVRVVLAP